MHNNKLNDYVGKSHNTAIIECLKRNPTLTIHNANALN